MDFKRTVASGLGQPDLTRLSVYPAPHSQRMQDHHPSGCDTQPPPSVVHPPWVACRGRGAESQRQIVRHLLFFPFTLLFASDRLERILHRLSETIVSVIDTTQSQFTLILYVLRDLVMLENRPRCLTEMAYKWYSVICENRRRLEDWESLLPISLEIGFRHLDPWRMYIRAELTHTWHHQGLVDIVFGIGGGEEIADLLHAWTAEGLSHGPAHILLSACTSHLVGLHNLVPFSSRLRRLVIRSVEDIGYKESEEVGVERYIGYKEFEGVGVERFIGLLNYLHVTVEDMDSRSNWANLLLDTLQSPEGPQHLSYWYWELLVELISEPPLRIVGDVVYNPQTVTLLTEGQEWEKLECWMGIVWMVWPPGAGWTTEEDLGRTMLSLFRQRPGAAQKLEQWVERHSQKYAVEMPESFRRVCEQAHEAAQRDTP